MPSIQLLFKFKTYYTNPTSCHGKVKEEEVYIYIYIFSHKDELSIEQGEKQKKKVGKGKRHELTKEYLPCNCIYNLCANFTTSCGCVRKTYTHTRRREIRAAHSENTNAFGREISYTNLSHLYSHYIFFLVCRKVRELREVFSFVFTSLFCVRVGEGCIRTSRFKWFSLYYFLYSIILIVNFFRIVSARRCKLLKLKHLNRSFSCDCIIFYSIFFCFVDDLGILVCHNKYFISLSFCW